MIISVPTAFGRDYVVTLCVNTEFPPGVTSGVLRLCFLSPRTRRTLAALIVAFFCSLAGADMDVSAESPVPDEDPSAALLVDPAISSSASTIPIPSAEAGESAGRPIMHPPGDPLPPLAFPAAGAAHPPRAGTAVPFVEVQKLNVLALCLERATAWPRVDPLKLADSDSRAGSGSDTSDAGDPAWKPQRTRKREPSPVRRRISLSRASTRRKQQERLDAAVMLELGPDTSQESSSGSAASPTAAAGAAVSRRAPSPPRRVSSARKCPRAPSPAPSTAAAAAVSPPARRKSKPGDRVKGSKFRCIDLTGESDVPEEAVHTPPKWSQSGALQHDEALEHIYESDSGTARESAEDVCGNIHDPAVRKFWLQMLQCGGFVASILANGYRIDFTHMPQQYEERNNATAREDLDFVRAEVMELERTGRVRRLASQPWCTSPLTVASRVVDSGKTKKRLVLDLSRHVNLCVKREKFTLATIKHAQELVQSGDFLFTYDMKAMFHHVRIAEEHQKYLGFQVPDEDGTPRYYCYVVLPFGLSSAVFLVNRLMKPLNSYLSQQGIRHQCYIDDGIVVSSDTSECSRHAIFVLETLA